MEARLFAVTGAASGIGAEIARCLRTAGCRALELDRAFPTQGGAPLQWSLDVGKDADILETFDRIDREKLELSGWVNCAGIALLDACLDLPVESFRQTFEVNVFGPFLCSQLAAARLKKSGGGRIVNIVSISAFRAAMHRVAYGPSKSALVALTRQFAAELATENIQVNAVAPGPIETDMSRSLHGAKTRKAYLDQVPSRRYGTPEEVAEVVRYLLLDAPAFLTGDVIAVDGGYLCAGMSAVEPKSSIAA